MKLLKKKDTENLGKRFVVLHLVSVASLIDPSVRDMVATKFVAREIIIEAYENLKSIKSLRYVSV